MMFSWLERHSKQTLQQEVRSTASPSLPKMKSTRTTSYISATVEPAFNQSMRDSLKRELMKLLSYLWLILKSMCTSFHGTLSHTSPQNINL